jgi:hypothetical protein
VLNDADHSDGDVEIITFARPSRFWSKPTAMYSGTSTDYPLCENLGKQVDLGCTDIKIGNFTQAPLFLSFMRAGDASSSASTNNKTNLGLAKYATVGHERNSNRSKQTFITESSAQNVPQNGMLRAYVMDRRKLHVKDIGSEGVDMLTHVYTLSQGLNGNPWEEMRIICTRTLVPGQLLLVYPAALVDPFARQCRALKYAELTDPNMLAYILAHKLASDTLTAPNAPIQGTLAVT